MLTKVEISNFMCHRKTTFEFIPGTNVIIGESDQGKSAAFNAINWVISNRPLGDAFRSEWGGDTEVTLHTAEGNVVKRFRSATKNEYIVNGQVLTAFGSEVPEDVTNVLQLDHANIQAQIDPHFLLAATPGEAARMLNKAASIDDIDRAVAGLRRSYGRIDSDIKYDEKLLDEYNEQMELYSLLPTIEAKLQLAERLEKEREGKVSSLELLKEKTKRGREIEHRIRETEHIPKLLQKCEEAEKQHLSYQNKLSQHQKYSAVSERGKELQKALDATEYIDRAIPILRKSEEHYTNWKEKSKQLEKFRQLVARAREADSFILRSQKVIEQLEEKLHELAPESCPIYGESAQEFCPLLQETEESV